MKKIIVSSVAILATLSLTSCEKTLEENNSEIENGNSIENNEELNNEETEILEIESSESTENEREKSDLELEYPERFDAVTGESIQKPM